MAHQVTVFWDFSSPFSYLGCTQISALCERHGASLTWHPLLLGAVFKALGTPMVPIMAFSEAKRRHAMLDLVRYAQHWGVPFRWPTRFPMKTVTALRLVLAAQDNAVPETADLIQRIYRAFWAEDRDINDRAVLTELADEVGLDGAGLIEQTADPDIKKALFARTQEAVEAGVFGVPTFLVDGQQLFWGQDRLDLVERLLG